MYQLYVANPSTDQFDDPQAPVEDSAYFCAGAYAVEFIDMEEILIGSRGAQEP